jgi:hypothetical protein
MKKALFVLAAVAVAGVAVAWLERERRARHYVSSHRTVEPIRVPRPVVEPVAPEPVAEVTPAPAEVVEPVQAEVVEQVPAEVEAFAEAEAFDSEWDEPYDDEYEASEPVDWDEIVQAWTT